MSFHVLNNSNGIRGCRGHDHMIVGFNMIIGFTTTSAISAYYH